MRQMGMLHTQNTHILGPAVVCTSFCGKIHQLPLRMERETVYTVPSHLQRPFSGPPHIRRLSIHFCFFGVSMMCFYKGEKLRTPPLSLSLSLSLSIYIYSVKMSNSMSAWWP